ncbi:flagellar hook-length control protein FliK [Propionivibrio dicarboxylicus]|uniref:Hook-length control protein FliK n=1 Tax=Propionivibrio dicarboxylicus TaxID=83767 RepID=A0A1G8HBU4_9RHOO|nr:flagellar hook-length control protein FliK [Propionivibrio dicarboxylicus]SDI04137.1 hook-length control protein FliK [Propionivibrio dicarboxylicus]
MIPADVVSQLQNSVSATRGASSHTNDIGDKLAGLVAGQKVVAEIQAILPNGVYRAVIAQRSVTLALPFSAKAGDSLELEVTETDGKLALAVLSRPDGDKAATTSASATLSQTAQLISSLYSDARKPTDKEAMLTLNSNLPILNAAPENGGEIAPLLKQALQQSGMFYESHQAEWVEGRLDKADLLREPQGKLTPATVPTTDNQASMLPAGSVNVAGQPANSPATDSTGSNAVRSETSTPAQSPAQTIAPQLQSLVQQQLEALATQHFVWQGQIWPGQNMQWEIDEDASHAQTDEPGGMAWATRLRLRLPSLGEVEAQLQLRGNRITVSLRTGDADTEQLLRANGNLLTQQLDAAGLALTSFGVSASAEEDAHGEQA